MISLLALLLLSSCSKEYPDFVDGGGEEKDNKVTIELFTRAEEYETPVARATADENGLDMTPWVFVFSGADGNATLVEVARGIQLNGVNKRYVVLESRTGTCQILILANAPANYYYGGSTRAFTEANLNTLIGTRLSNFCSGLLTVPLASTVTTAPFIGEKLPMSYLLTTVGINNNTQIGTTANPLQLTRNVARISVRESYANRPDGLADATMNDFELMGITSVANVADRGQFHNLSNTPPSGITTTCLYRGTGDIAAAEATGVSDLYNEKWTYNNPIYVYETLSTNGAYLIIRGEYKGEECFYKMLLQGSDGAMLNLARNTAYYITINSVRGIGYKTYNDALLGAASNEIGFSVQMTDVSSHEIVANNNDFFLAVTNSHYIAYTASNAATYTAFSVITDCTTAFETRYIKSLTTGLTIVSPTSLPNSTNPTPVTIRFASTFTNSTVGQIEIGLGNLRKIITVERRAVPANGSTIQYYSGSTFTHYCVSGRVDAGTSWLKLATGTGFVWKKEDGTDDGSKITVDDGKIQLKVGTASSTVGTAFLSTINDPSSGSTDEIKRIKIDIQK